MWICVCGHTPDVVIYSKFHRNPFRGFGAPVGRNLPIPITLAIGFYNRLHYRASRDVFYGSYICIHGDDVNSCFYPFVNKLELSK